MKTILFGAGRMASMVWYCLSHDSDHQVVAFAVDPGHCHGTELHGLSVVPFESLPVAFSPREHALLICVGGHDMNKLRRDRLLSAKAWGYPIATYVSSRAITWPDLDTGEGSMIFAGAAVSPFVKIGAGAIVSSGVHIGHHVRVGDYCMIAPAAAIGGSAVIGERCTVGLNASIRNGVRVAEGCLIAAGAALTADTEADGLYLGVPARRATKPASQVKD